MSEIYNSLKQPPQWALKNIQAGRLKGKSDINPQWRIEKMDEVFGLCGQGWTYEIIDLFTLPGGNNEVAAFAKINLYTCKDGEWSRPIPGIGGSMLVEQEKNGLHTNDECFKMAVTDALSVAMKSLGMAADVYKGLWDGAKYKIVEPVQKITDEQFARLQNLGADMVNLAKACKVNSVRDLTFEQAEKAIKKKEQQANA